jgi:hypothetical protein
VSSSQPPVHPRSATAEGPESLSAAIRRLLASTGPEGVSVGQILDRVGSKGFGLLLLILSLPSALPVPAPGYSTPFGLLLAALGLQMIAGRRIPWLPEFARKRSISADAAEKLGGAAERFLLKTEKLVRPRLRWLNSRPAAVFVGVITLLMASLMILPIPLTNTAPAMVVFALGIGLSQKDGLFTALAAFGATLATAFYGYVIYLLATLGVEGVIQLKDAIRGWLGL